MTRPMTIGRPADRADGPQRGLLGALDEQADILGDLAHEERGVGVAVHPADEGGDVDVADVTFAQDRVVGIPWQITSLRLLHSDFGKPR